MGWLKYALGVLAMFFTVSAGAAQSGDPEGRWALHAGGRTLMILELSRDKAAPGALTGQLLVPEKLGMSGTRAPGSHSFSGIEGPVVRREVRNTVRRGDELELSIESRRAGETDAYIFRVAPDGSGELAFAGITLAPLTFVRAAPGEAVTEVWDAKQTYLIDWQRPSNPEMTALFAADQAGRGTLGAEIDWDALAREDSARRERTKTLLDAGALQSGDDFYHAAFIFQHGDQPSDFLMAHTLAMIAIARGRRDATWIAAATLDRYLKMIGQGQIYGTQYGASQKDFAQEPYDRALISDALREAMGVPPLAEQEEERLRMMKRRAEIRAGAGKKD